MTSIRLRLTPHDVQRIRLAVSPLSEIALSFYMLRSGEVPPVHRPWVTSTLRQLQHVDVEALSALLPVQGEVADFMFVGIRDANTTLEMQLKALAQVPRDRLLLDMEKAWHASTCPYGTASGGAEVPRLARDLVTTTEGLERMTRALQDYWVLCLGPAWDRVRSTLEADVAHRGSNLLRAGLDGLLADLHPRLRLHQDWLHIEPSLFDAEVNLRGEGLVLIPSAFAGSYLWWHPSECGPVYIAYQARGAANLWQPNREATQGAGSLAALMGRGRASVLVAVDLPLSTTDLSRQLGQSLGAVSAHLGILRAGGLVHSWRSGRRVLYARTALGHRMVEANCDADSELDDHAPG
ncbi:MAG: ArsR family transcriptional regulator [Nocardioidaceae bacterium]|nr:ArsR family transcriptional regulator [Nocardioidaceae bacterium]